MNTRISEIVQDVLVAYGYTEKHLAERIGVTQPTVHRLKTGQIKNPSWPVGARLLKLHEDRPETDLSA